MSGEKKEIHVFDSTASVWQVVQSIEHLAKEQGGYTWQPGAPVPVLVRQRLKKLCDDLQRSPKCNAVIAELIESRETNWKVIVPALEPLVPLRLSKTDRTILLDLLVVTYAYNMGVSIPYMALN